MSIKQRAKEGDKVLFSKENLSIIGVVKKVAEDNIVVELNQPDANRIQSDTLFTVVSHNQYQIVVL